MQNTLPIWARVPKHRQEVVATEKGWVVKETGELLRSVTNLPARLEQLKEDVDVSLQASTGEPVKVSEEDLNDIENELGQEEDSGDQGSEDDESESEQIETQDDGSGEHQDPEDNENEPDEQDSTDPLTVESFLESKSEDELKELYQETFGKKPHHMKKADSLREELAEEITVESLTE